MSKKPVRKSPADKFVLFFVRCCVGVVTVFLFTAIVTGLVTVTGWLVPIPRGLEPMALMATVIVIGGFGLLWAWIEGWLE